MKLPNMFVLTYQVDAQYNCRSKWNERQSSQRPPPPGAASRHLLLHIIFRLLGGVSTPRGPRLHLSLPETRRTQTNWPFPLLLPQVSSDTCYLDAPPVKNLPSNNRNPFYGRADPDLQRGTVSISELVGRSPKQTMRGLSCLLSHGRRCAFSTHGQLRRT